MGEMSDYYAEHFYPEDKEEYERARRYKFLSGRGRYIGAAESVPYHKRLWITRDRRELLICKMANSHLLNTIRFLERRAEDIQSNECLRLILHAATLRGDASMNCADQELRRLQMLDPTEYLARHHTPYKWLVDEARRRQLLSHMVGPPNLEAWLHGCQAVWGSSQRLAYFIEWGILDPRWGVDYWEDNQGVWSVEVLPDGTAVTVCYED